MAASADSGSLMASMLCQHSLQTEQINDLSRARQHHAKCSCVRLFGKSFSGPSSWQQVIRAENGRSRRDSQSKRVLRVAYLPRIRATGPISFKTFHYLQQSDFRGCSIDCLREPVKSAAVACPFCLLKPAGVRKATLPHSKVSWLPVCVDEVLWILKFLRDC